MMKWLRKYNKQIMGVAASFLLVVWLGGEALRSAGRRNMDNEVIGRCKWGPITQGDHKLADFESNLQRSVGLNWQANWGRVAGKPLTTVDWILLNREADHQGIHVTQRDVRRVARANGLSDTLIKQVALRRDVTPERIYAALASYFKVGRMVALYQSALRITEQGVRVAARDQLERATINAVKLPAASFADPEQTFTDDQIARQYEKYKDSRRVPGSQTFGYYREPRVTIQYVEIDPEKVKALLPGDERSYLKRALEYWKANRDKDPAFRRSQEQIDAVLKNLPEQKDEQGNPLPKPPVPPYFEKFEQAQSAAIDAVKTREAKAQTARLANQLIKRLAQPWFNVAAERNAYKPAPEAVRRPEHYEKTLAQWPEYRQYKDAIRIGILGPVTEAGLADVDDMGAAFYPAFAVEGLTEIPKDTDNRSMYKSLWETSNEPVTARNGKVYVYRVIKSQPGRPPSGLDEVRDEVIEDLRVAAALDRAVQAGQELAQAAAKSSLKEAWEADRELADRVTPDAGGYLPSVNVTRNNPFWGRLVPQIGAVNEEFINTAFRLAADADKADPEVVRQDDLNLAVVIEGQSLAPLYDQMYQQQRAKLAGQLTQQRVLEALRAWLQPDQIRERNGYEPGPAGDVS